MHFTDYFIHTGCPKLLAYCFNTRYLTHQNSCSRLYLDFSVDSSSYHITDTFKLTDFVTNNVIIYTYLVTAMSLKVAISRMCLIVQRHGCYFAHVGQSVWQTITPCIAVL